MHFDLEQRRAWLSAGELADFLIGPREAGASAMGLWRAQLGVRWHQELRERAIAAGSSTRFEVETEGEIIHRGWTLALGGRIDQLACGPDGAVICEIKTVTRTLPADEAELRADYPGYFVQLAAYAEISRVNSAPARGELVFVELSTGTIQTVRLTEEDASLFRGQLDRVAEFLELRLRAFERLRHLRFRAPFDQLRHGQAEAVEGLQSAVRARPLNGPAPKILLDAPTGFGKTGVLLEFALGELKAGRFERLVYLTSKATGQLQVVRTLQFMTAPGNSADGTSGATVAVWQMRAKTEHCINSVFHCMREKCAYLDRLAERWPESGLSRFYLFEHEPRDLDTLRAAGRAAMICPYEITRAALAFNDVWIGDYNYVFAPANRGLFFQQPGFDPRRTLLIVDEAHNLPARAADARSHAFLAADAQSALDALRRIQAPASLVLAWEAWAVFLAGVGPADILDATDESEGRRLIELVTEESISVPLDRSSLPPPIGEWIGRIPAAASELESVELPRLWWSPRAGELRITCLDAADAIGAALREFGAAVLASATPGPSEAFAEACGLSEEAELARVEAPAPWREHAYDVACDLRMDTTFQQRARYYPLTAATIEALAGSSESAAAAVFFSSYAYAERVLSALADSGSTLRAALQPRLPDLAAQAAWVEESLASSDVLFLVLGSSFSESIDLLGGRVNRAMVVGPALPEVNAVQRARLAVHASFGRDAAFRRVYRIPGMQKVNQALGRLVRAPGQSAKVLLHCRRFAEPAFAALLAPEYRSDKVLRNNDDLDGWLAR